MSITINNMFLNNNSGPFLAGPPGQPGPPGAALYTYARHSQLEVLPSCGYRHAPLWQGFSLLHTEDEGRAHVQDLGQLKADE